MLISEHHILESLLEPEGGDDLDVLELDRLFQGLSLSFTPDQVRNVFTEPSTMLASMLRYSVAEVRICYLSIRDDLKEEA